MLPREPARWLARIADVLQVVETPHDVAVEVHLDQVDLILEAVPWVPLTRAAKHLPARQQLVWKALQPAPELNLAAAHVDE